MKIKFFKPLLSIFILFLVFSAFYPLNVSANEIEYEGSRSPERHACYNIYNQITGYGNTCIIAPSGNCIQSGCQN